MTLEDFVWLVLSLMAPVILISILGHELAHAWVRKYRMEITYIIVNDEKKTGIIRYFCKVDEKTGESTGHYIELPFRVMEFRVQLGLAPFHGKTEVSDMGIEKVVDNHPKSLMYFSAGYAFQFTVFAIPVLIGIPLLLVQPELGRSLIEAGLLTSIVMLSDMLTSRKNEESDLNRILSYTPHPT